MTRSPSAISPASFSLQPDGQLCLAYPGAAERSTLADRIAVNQATTQPWSFGQDLDEYEACGVSAIGLTVDKMTRYGVEKASDRMSLSPMAVSSLNWIAGFTGANGYGLPDTIDEGIETLRLAHEVGAPTVVAVSGPRNGHTWNHADRIVVDALSELGDYADRLGIDIALQPMGGRYRARWSFVSTLAHGLNLVRQIDHPRVGLSVHSSHVFREKALPRVLEEAAEWVRLVRLGDCGGRPQTDNDQRWLGQGRVPMNAIAAVLDREGYRGYYEVDVWSRALWQSGEFRPLLESVHRLTFGSPPPPAPTFA